ncbi:MAG: helix-turn-helix domain-containing protein [Chloroflexota bacterium]|nr:helix-turn-helix domain-containing protein [Chloroflexota bacterium]
MAEERASPFGDQLRRLREAAGITQEELAERAGLSRDAIGALERGHRRHPHPRTVRALAAALSLSAGEATALRAVATKRPSGPPSPRAEARVARLPVPLTRLVGRHQELAELRQLLTAGQARLVTLTGPGGVGKTRLALELLSQLEAAYPDGVVFVPLASLGNPDLVLPTIADAIGVSEMHGVSLVERLAQVLGEQRRLLVLDNFEHVVGAASQVAGLLATCPALVVLVTSRTILRLSGEQEYPVPPLSVPRPTRWEGLPDLVATDAVALFVERARSASPSFQLTNHNAAAVAAICWRLGGLPLALELAAARVRFLGPTELLARLDQALQSGGAQDLPARQRTLRATLDWSYDLLAEPERGLLRRLAVFAGGFTLEAAEAVGPGGADSAGEVFSRLGALVEQSLVTATHDEHGTRYGLLEPIRQYARGQLAESGEAEEAQRRHAAFYLGFAEQAALELEGRSEQIVWLERLDREHDNLRAALTWSEQAAAGAEVGLRLAAALWRYWEVRWHVGEGSRWLAGALARSEGLPPVLRANALNAAGNLARDQADHGRAAAYHERGLELRRQLGDRRGIASSLNNLGVIARDRGDAERTLLLCAESRELYRAVGDHQGAAIASLSLAMAAGQQGDVERARSHFAESLAWFRTAGDRWHTGWVLNYMAEVLVRYGATEDARAAAEEGLALHRVMNDAWGHPFALGVLGRIAHMEDDLVTAVTRFVEALRLVVDAGVKPAMPGHLEDLAGVALAHGQPDRAARLGGAGEVLRDTVGIPRSASDWWHPGPLDLAGLRSGWPAAWAAGRGLPLDVVLAEAAALADEIARDGAGQSSETFGIRVEAPLPVEPGAN